HYFQGIMTNVLVLPSTSNLKLRPLSFSISSTDDRWRLLSISPEKYVTGTAPLYSMSRLYQRLSSIIAVFNSVFENLNKPFFHPVVRSISAVWVYNRLSTHTDSSPGFSLTDDRRTETLSEPLTKVVFTS